MAMKDSLELYPTWWLLFVRFGGGTLLMGACFYKRIVASFKSGHALLDAVCGLVIGIFLFLGMGVQTLGLNFTTAGKQAFLTAGYIVMVPLIVWVMSRRFPGWLTIAGSVICFTGMGFLTSDVTDPLNIGDILTVIAALFFAAQIITISRCAAKSDPFVLTFWQFLVAAISSITLALVFEGRFVYRGSDSLPGLFFVTFFCTFLCFMIQNVAQKHTSASHAALLLGLESVFGLLGGVFLLGETFTLQMSLGCALIFGAVLLVELAPAFLRK
ncbi:multidrug transporter [Synergistales bacterium]|nr:multidrug transporter [Synergistales bacterium]